MLINGNIHTVFGQTGSSHDTIHIHWSIHLDDSDVIVVRIGMKLLVNNDRFDTANYGIFVQFLSVVVYQDKFDAPSVESGIY